MVVVVVVKEEELEKLTNMPESAAAPDKTDCLVTGEAGKGDGSVDGAACAAGGMLGAGRSRTCRMDREGKLSLRKGGSVRQRRGDLKGYTVGNTD